MSTDFSLGHVYLAQSLLQQNGIASVVSGDLGLLYHGVDIALHHVEICVPNSEAQRAREVIGSRVEFVPLSDVTEPDFYHPYKRGAYRFGFAGVSDGVDLHIITDTALPLRMVPVASSANTVKSTLSAWCHDTDESVFGGLAFPTLSNFLNAWLDLASQARAQNALEQSVFMMEAERLIDGNSVIDHAWCKDNIRSSQNLLLARHLLEGQATRMSYSNWD